MKNILYLLFLLGSVTAYAQSGFNYQGVLRNTAGEIMANASIDLRFRLTLDTTLSDQFNFEEVHQVSTNNFGVFSAVIGFTDPEKLKSLDYSETYFIEVALRPDSQSPFVVLNRSQLSTVPTAMHAMTVENADDADADPTNEIQILAFDSSNNTLQISGGNAVQIPTGGSDADADPTNELQQITKIGNRIRLSDGGEVVDDDEDNDADPQNEIQQISKVGNFIKLSDGGEVLDEVVDDDADPTNEIQKISMSGSKIRLSKNGGEIMIPKFNQPWQNEGDDFIFYPGKVGIGTSKSEQKLSVNGMIETRGFKGFNGDYRIDFIGGAFNFFDKQDKKIQLNMQNNINFFDGSTTFNGPSDRFGVRIASGKNVSKTGGGWLRIGSSLVGDQRIVMDANDIQSINRDAPASLSINPHGGHTMFSSASGATGKVGIQTVPTHELHVKHRGSSNGSAGIKIENSGNNKNWWSLYTANGSGQFEFYHKGVIKGRILPTDGTYVKSSDARLKHDVIRIGSVLDKVQRLAPKSYLFNDHPHAEKRSLGFIAQEVEKLFPNLVQYNPSDKNKFLSLNYDGFSVLAIKAIQEQQTMIDDQHNEIEQLHGQMQNLQTEVKELKNIIHLIIQKQTRS